MGLTSSSELLPEVGSFLNFEKQNGEKDSAEGGFPGTDCVIVGCHVSDKSSWTKDALEAKNPPWK